MKLYVVTPDIIMYPGYHVLTSTLEIGFSGQVKILVLNTNYNTLTLFPGDLIGQLIYIKKHE